MNKYKFTMNKRKVTRFLFRYWHLLLIGLLIIVVIGEPFVRRRVTEETITITVTDKSVKRYDDKDKYLIYTDKGTYEITDTVAYFRYDSSDLYGRMKVGKTYECTVCGWRIPIFSRYKNIITAKEVNN